MAVAPGSRREAVDGLLDDGLLSGQHETVTVLRPERLARPVAADDMPALLTEIEHACQVWGGAGHPMLPVRDGRLPGPYLKLLGTEQIDYVGGLQNLMVALPPRVDARRSWDHPAILVAAHEPLERWRTVQVVDLDPADPWRPVYDAVLGRWPEVPDPEIGRWVGLREDLRFEDAVPVERVPATGSLHDLVERLDDRAVLRPRQISNIEMSYGLRPDTSFLGLGADEQVLPNPHMTRRAAGPNLIVAVTPGSVEDVALLWNLRSAHGDSHTMPIGVPVEHLSPQVLAELQQPGRATRFGLGGGHCYLISASLSLHELTTLTDRADSVRAVDYESVLSFGPAPGRRRRRMSTWLEGRARLEPLSEADREVLDQSLIGSREPDLVLDVTVENHLLPADTTMRGRAFFGRFQAGAAQVDVAEARVQRTVEVTWPSTWTCLAAVAHTHGLQVRESKEGLAAATLVRALGGIHMIWMLQHQPLIALLYRMAERSGMAWWKKKWTESQRAMRAAGADAATVERAAQAGGRDEPVVAPAGEGRAMPFQAFVTALGSELAAGRWVTWAERRHLLVRGADITCPDCETKAWLPMAALPPPVPCPGCGRLIDQPYGPRALAFTYRLGEPLRRVLETDSLGHLLALHWLTQLLDRRGLVGAHPGVTFTPLAQGAEKPNDIGEADVLLLFADGSLVPVEVKRSLAGVDQRAIESLDTLADALGASWDVFAVTAPARDMPSLAGVRRDLPERPRIVLTDDQLYEEHVMWSVGRNPFAWAPRTREEDADRQRAYIRRLTAQDPEEPWDLVAEALLGPKPGAGS